ncbi:MAG: DUF5686 family protein [Balneolaceae bacterium]|nr:DUF5686 family protein [Balneolaceae bacterium]
MPCRFISLLPIALFLLSSPLFAQTYITGKVTDAETGEVLPAANISIEGTYRGTITNRNGEYNLSIPDSLLPALVQVRFIGFKTEVREINGESDRQQDFALQPSVTEMEEIVVTDEDPGVRIMREVIKRKQKWRTELNTYSADAYTRQSLANDTSIVMITETISKAFWDKEEGHREIIKSKKQTANIEAADNFAGVSYVPNFYDDNVEVAGFEVVGITHPDALRYYDFKLIDQTTLDGKQVYKIEVIPDRNLQPLFKGTVYVLSEAYALLEVSLTPNKVVKFPPPVKKFEAYYQQQYNNYGGDFWLPVDMRIEGNIKISMVGLDFPNIIFRQLSRITDYKVNVTLPDSIYKDNDLFTVDSTTINNDSLFENTVDVVPLSQEEEQAYTKLDSTATLEKAFRPTGFLARFIDDEEDDSDGGGWGIFNKIPGNLNPKIRFNRVDELHAGLKYEYYILDNLKTVVSAGYSTGNKRWDAGGGASYEFDLSDDLSQNLGLSYWHETTQQFSSPIYSPGFTVLPNLLGAQNYYNYFRSEGFEAFTEFTHSPTDLSLKLVYENKEHSSLQVTSGYDLLATKNNQRINPAINEGTLSSLKATVGYNLNDDYSYGATGQKRIKAEVEYSDASVSSDFDFVQYRLGVDWNLTTFYKRRFLPNTLDIKLNAGTSTGTPPLQKYGIVDAALGYFSPFGVMKTIREFPYQGKDFISAYAEHNFRTVPFEILGLDFLVDRNYGVIAFGGAAKTWLPNSQLSSLTQQGYVPRVANDWHLEAGLSLNGVLGLFRIDFAQRLDKPAFLVNVSVSRFF